MIALVTGPPGAGKTFYAVRKMIDSLEAGKFVASNVELVPDWAERVARAHPMRWLMPGRRTAVERRLTRNVYLTPSLEELSRVRLKGRKEGRGVLVLDEAHMWMNSRMWKDGDRLDVVGFFSQHRKLGWDVYLITQDINNIDRQVRGLFEYHVTLRNLRRMKVAGIPVSPFNLFLAIWKWHAAGGAVAKRECYRLNYTAKLYSTMATVATKGVSIEAADPIWLPLPAPAKRPRKQLVAPRAPVDELLSGPLEHAELAVAGEAGPDALVADVDTLTPGASDGRGGLAPAWDAAPDAPPSLDGHWHRLARTPAPWQAPWRSP